VTPLEKKLAETGCEVRFDNLARQMYATDASIYEIQPAGVAFPRNAREASNVIRAVVEAGISITPRGAGTSLSGGAIGDGVIVDFSRHNRGISNLNIEKGTVTVGPGVVLDQLNAFLRPHGFCFGPDVATSSRATLGGMIANNSSGARVPVYGTTADHTVSLEIVLSDGRVERIGKEYESLGVERNSIEKLIQSCQTAIAERMPSGLLKRWPGYGVERFLRRRKDLTEILAGSEGTLAAICSAEVKISPLPREKGLGVIFFASIGEAMQATVELLDLRPAAIEHIDRPLLDQTKGQLLFQPARDLLELDTSPCEALLLVEFQDENVSDRLAALESRKLGLRRKILRTAQEMNLVWAVRKAGLLLLTGCVGPAKPVAFIEDAAVRPEQLPDYVAGLQSIMKSLGLEASYYGHAATGLLHVRPVIDLHDPGDLRKFRKVADETSALVRQFKGSLSAEHGVGIARTEYMEEQLGADLFGLMKAIKNTFDPKGAFNPGKILADGRHRIDTHLRDTFSRPIELPFEPRLTFAFKDRSFIGNLEQCNGCGGCRKDTPMMCPTFVATGDEVMSTRGRANIIRAALQMRVQGGDPLRSDELEIALSNCLSCKGCTPECPSNVNLALLKAELTHARHRRDGLPLRERMLSNVDVLAKLGCAVPAIANTVLEMGPLRLLLDRVAGLSAKRTLPRYARERFDRWFATRNAQTNGAAKGEVILWDDTFVRYHEPHIGKAALKVLEAIGYRVRLLTQRECCGRPAFSQGNLDHAAKAGQRNLDLLRATDKSTPILFLEPSCYSMFAEDYRELGLRGAEEIKERAVLFESFLDKALEKDASAFSLATRGIPINVAIHAHCHAKSLMHPGFMSALVERLPNRKAVMLDTGCCGMAGAFGMLSSKYELSVKVAQPLVDQIDACGPDTVVVASGTSCRHQISDLTNIEPKHMAEVFADALNFG
jgi:FAD/FMN-containing dehydrogenase/Fe-S oxidoreductase